MIKYFHFYFILLLSINSFLIAQETVLPGQQQAINTLAVDLGFSEKSLNEYIQTKFGKPLSKLTKKQGSELIVEFTEAPNSSFLENKLIKYNNSTNQLTIISAIPGQGFYAKNSGRNLIAAACIYPASALLWAGGYVVLGRDIIALMTFYLVAQNQTNKRLNQIDVTIQAYDATGNPKWTYSPGERGQIIMTLINQGSKRAKGLKPKIKLESIVIDNQFGQLSVQTKGNKNQDSLEPGESMSIATTFEIPASYPATSIDVRGSISRTLYGNVPLKIEGTESRIYASTATSYVAEIDIEKKIPIGKKNKNAFAVVFGIEVYKNVSSVTYANRDAYWMREYFEKTLGVPSKNIYYKTNSDVSQAEFSKVFSEGGWLDKRIKDGQSDVFVYYAGHGAPDIKKNKAYLIPFDGDPNYASQTGYEVDVLYKQLGQLGSRNTTVFLDACFSGANRENEILLAGARPVFIEVKSGIPGNVSVFSAAGSKQISSSWNEKKHGLFSYFLMKGMGGEADSNKDKKISMGELGDYISENVSGMAGMLDREQSPELQTIDNSKLLINY